MKYIVVEMGDMDKNAYCDKLTHFIAIKINQQQITINDFGGG